MEPLRKFYLRQEEVLLELQQEAEVKSRQADCHPQTRCTDTKLFLTITMRRGTLQEHQGSKYRPIHCQNATVQRGQVQELRRRKRSHKRQNLQLEEHKLVNLGD